MQLSNQRTIVAIVSALGLAAASALHAASKSPDLNTAHSEFDGGTASGFFPTRPLAHRDDHMFSLGLVPLKLPGAPLFEAQLFDDPAPSVIPDDLFAPTRPAPEVDAWTPPHPREEPRPPMPIPAPGPLALVAAGTLLTPRRRRPR